MSTDSDPDTNPLATEGERWSAIVEAAIAELEIIDAAQQVVRRWPWPVEPEGELIDRRVALEKLLKTGSEELRDLVEQVWDEHSAERETQLRQIGWLLRRVGRGDLWRAYFRAIKGPEYELGDELRWLLDDKTDGARG